MSKKKTTEEYKSELKSINHNIEPCEEYQGANIKILHRCLICGNIWKINPHNILSGYGCPTCALVKKTKTTEEYKERLKSINPNIEPLEEYINNKTKILHRCLICGNIWKTSPNNALNGYGCPACALVKKTKTIEEYREQLKSINPNIEPLEEYINNKTKILHRCLICNYEWKATPGNILVGRGCPACVGVKKRTAEEYKEELKSINPNIEPYEEYINTDTKILHKCLICGNIWKAAPTNILRGNSCPDCASLKRRKTTEEYKSELKSINPNIEPLEEYVTAHVKILHKCLICGNTWKIKSNDALRGVGCPKCNTVKKTTEEYKSELKEKNPNIEPLEEYINNKTKILHKCLKCENTWKTTPSSILKGNGCPHCRSSHGEKAVENFLLENKISFIPQKKFSDCKDKQPLPFDFYLPEKNIAIEYQGIQHYKPVETFGGEKRLHKQRHHDWLKRKYCQKKGITLITISYKENVKNVLEIKLNMNEI